MRNWESNFYDDDEFREILDAYEQSIQGGPETYLDADDLTDIAEYYYSLGRLDDARRVIEHALELHPDATAPLTYLVHDHISAERWDEARRVLDSIDDMDEDREVMYLRVELMIHDERLREADEMLLAHYPTDAPELEQREYIREVIGLYLDYMPNPFDAEDGLVIAVKEWGERLTQMPRLNTDDRMMLADMHSCVQQTDEALALIDQIVNKKPYYREAWTLMTDIHVRAKQYDDAIEACEYALAIDDTDKQVMLTLAWLYAEQYNAAMHRWEDGIVLDEKNLDEMCQRYHDECLRLVAESEKERDFFPPEDYEAAMGDMMMNIDEPLLAMPHFERNLQQHPDSATAHYWYGLTLIDAQQFGEAAEHLARAAETEPKEFGTNTHAPLSYCYYMMGDRDKCLRHLTVACKQTPDLAALYFRRFFTRIDPHKYYMML